MQRQLFFIGLGLTALTSLTTLVTSIYPALGQSNSSNAKPDKVTFLCKEIFDKASGEKVPATIAWVPERQAHVRFIAWKSEWFGKSGWTPQKRCENVTQKFQQSYEQKRLNYFSYGMNNGYQIICALANQGETCNSTNQLFTIKSTNQPELVLQKLLDISEGKSGEILFQSSGQQIYVDVRKFLSNAPVEISQK